MRANAQRLIDGRGRGTVERAEVTTAATGPTTRHAVARERLLAQYAAIPAGDPVRLAKRTSNLFRPRARAEPARASTSRVSTGCSRWTRTPRTADVQGMTTYEHLVDATLPHGLMPTVVPQLKTITLGGAVTGLGIESSSFRKGCRTSRSARWRSSPAPARSSSPRRHEHADLFRAFPNSYGTLGYALRLEIELRAGPAVRPAAARPLRRPRPSRSRDRRDRRERTVGRRAGRLPRRHGVLGRASAT